MITIGDDIPVKNETAKWAVYHQNKLTGELIPYPDPLAQNGDSSYAVIERVRDIRIGQGRGGRSNESEWITVAKRKQPNHPL